MKSEVLRSNPGLGSSFFCRLFQHLLPPGAKLFWAVRWTHNDLLTTRWSLRWHGPHLPHLSRLCVSGSAHFCATPQSSLSFESLADPLDPLDPLDHWIRQQIHLVFLSRRNFRCNMHCAAVAHSHRQHRRRRRRHSFIKPYHLVVYTILGQPAITPAFHNFGDRVSVQIHSSSCDPTGNSGGRCIRRDGHEKPLLFFVPLT